MQLALIVLIPGATQMMLTLVTLGALIDLQVVCGCHGAGHHASARGYRRHRSSRGIG
jgi:hypothetical protein